MSPLFGQKILDEKDSPINGRVVVVKSVGLGTYIQVEGLTQSGSVVYDVWNTTLKKVKRQKPEVTDCLILGLGGGSAAKLVRKYWSNSKITGVDIDPVFVEFGKKYMGLDDTKVDIHLQDATKYIKKDTNKYNLILVDMYVGYKVPLKFTTSSFIRSVKKLLNKEGIVVFNRLYFGERRKLAESFSEELDKEFKNVKRIYPEANIMFVCEE